MMSLGASLKVAIASAFACGGYNKAMAIPCCGIATLDQNTIQKREDAHISLSKPHEN